MAKPEHHPGRLRDGLTRTGEQALEAGQHVEDHQPDRHQGGEDQGRRVEQGLQHLATGSNRLLSQVGKRAQRLGHIARGLARRHQRDGGIVEDPRLGCQRLGQRHAGR
jgi:hypothetical protein